MHEGCRCMALVYDWERPDLDDYLVMQTLSMIICLGYFGVQGRQTEKQVKGEGVVDGLGFPNTGANGKASQRRKQGG